MSYSDLQKALSLAPNCKFYTTAGGKSETDIAKSEQALNIKFSKQCLEFYKKCGYLSFYGNEIFGINPDDLEILTGNSVAFALNDRAVYSLPLKWLPVYEFGDGSMACLDYSSLNNDNEPPVIAAFFNGEEYYTFPTAKVLATKDEQFFKELGYGYRAKFMVEVANAIVNNQANLEDFAKLQTKDLKKQLVTLKGVGEKVADCVSLFGFRRTDSFPVDTWIEKIYKENFGGSLTDRKKITNWFLNEFGQFSGYIQQYLFYYKRSLEKYDKD